MAKKNIIIVLILTSLSLTGLVILQFYWINIDLKTSRAQFERDVYAMLNQIIHKIEKEETLRLVSREIDNSVIVENNFYSLETDSVGTAHWKEQQTVRIKQHYSSEKLKREGFTYEIEERAVISTTGTARKNKIQKGKAEKRINIAPEAKDILVTADTIRYPGKLNPSQTIRLVQKSDLISSVINELIRIDSSKSLNNRVNFPKIDTLISKGIKRKGLNMEYAFGIIDASGSFHKLIYANKPYLRNNILKSTFKSKLFPSDIYQSNYYLSIFFPHQKRYILTKIVLVLVASVLFIVLLIVSMGVAILTIIRQKKMSEITKDFISNMTHELKTPISTVSLACEALMDSDIRKIPHQETRYLGMIQEENKRLSLQVEKVLQIARLDKGDFRLKISFVNLHELIQTAVRNIDIQIEQRGGKITTQLEAENYHLEADRLHLSNIVNNLLDNANKYSPENPKISIKTLSNSAGIQLYVSDKGQGIPNEMLSRIFDKFYRIPTGNLHDVKGFGLGLSYVKTMVSAHNGRISVKSALGKGSTFIIFLPYKHEKS